MKKEGFIYVSAATTTITATIYPVPDAREEKLHWLVDSTWYHYWLFIVRGLFAVSCSAQYQSF
jgi:hypothetical protein